VSELDKNSDRSKKNVDAFTSSAQAGHPRALALPHAARPQGRPPRDGPVVPRLDARRAPPTGGARVNGQGGSRRKSWTPKRPYLHRACVCGALPGEECRRMGNVPNAPLSRPHVSRTLDSAEDSA
jgi:hypothetical protein